MDSSRYATQVRFLGDEAQNILEKSSALVIGCGALGSAAGALLARSGVQNIILFDDDVVELSNLQRQSAYEEADAGKKKCHSLAAHLEGINSNLIVEARDERVTQENIDSLPPADILLDCTDDLQMAYLINAYCTDRRIPYVHASVAGARGTLFAYTATMDFPCFRCAIGMKSGGDDAQNSGMLSSTPSLIASLQVTYAIRLLIHETVSPSYLCVDCWDMQIQHLKIKKNPQCPVCGGGA